MALKLPSLAKYYTNSGSTGSSGSSSEKALSINAFQQVNTGTTTQNQSGSTGSIMGLQAGLEPLEPLGTGSLVPDFAGLENHKDHINQCVSNSGTSGTTGTAENVRDSQGQGSKTSPIAANDSATDPGKTGTRRPAGLSPKLLAASLKLDQQILDSGKSLTPPEEPKPRLAASNPAKATTDAPPPIKRTDDNGWLKPDAAWKTLAQAYYLHHTHCPACIAAGLKPGKHQRCATGTTLWATYQSAIQ